MYGPDKPARFYHDYDPDHLEDDRWHFVYLHGEAEEFNEENRIANGWEWSASDTFCSPDPMPTEAGEYHAVLYGRPVIVVLADRRSLRGGRAALADDTIALDHCRAVDDWR
jgi:hypothetical protein